MNTTVPSVYHSITKVTEKWAQVKQAEIKAATRTPDARADSDREKQKREVHVTGKTNYPRKAT